MGESNYKIYSKEDLARIRLLASQQKERAADSRKSLEYMLHDLAGSINDLDKFTKELEHIERVYESVKKGWGFAFRIGERTDLNDKTKCLDFHSSHNDGSAVKEAALVLLENAREHERHMVHYRVGDIERKCREIEKGMKCTLRTTLEEI